MTHNLMSAVFHQLPTHAVSVRMSRRHILALPLTHRFVNVVLPHFIRTLFVPVFLSTQRSLVQLQHHPLTQFIHTGVNASCRTNVVPIHICNGNVLALQGVMRRSNVGTWLKRRNRGVRVLHSQRKKKFVLHKFIPCFSCHFLNNLSSRQKRYVAITIGCAKTVLRFNELPSPQNFRTRMIRSVPN